MNQEIKNNTLTLIDRKNLATRWGCSIMTIKRREKEGLLQPVDLMGRIVRYRIADIAKIENGEEFVQ